jgi:hypothetical protein
MYGFMNARIWMWVITVPAVIFTAVAVMGDSVEIALRAWWIAGPILLAVATVIWFSLGPAKTREETTAENALGAPAEKPKFDGADLLMRLALTPILTLLVLFAFALLFAFIMWLQPYWLILGPIYGGFALLVIYTLVKDELAKRAAARAGSVVTPAEAQRRAGAGPAGS